MNPCEGHKCGRTDTTWSHAFNSWLCTECRFRWTEQLLNHERHTPIPVTAADLTPTSDRPHP